MPETPAEPLPHAPAKFYLTTPIYYVNARPHIGHAYTTIVADVIARRHRLLGDDTFFLTGTDEHGQKIERSAAAAGIPPQQFADTVSKSFRDLWDRMGITYSDFIRTTEPRHQHGVQKLFQTLKDRGHIYLSTYTGQYCVSDEAYVDGPPGVRCPDCGRVTETVSESNFYFRLSAFQLPLLDLIESGPNGEEPKLRITPESRRNEVLSFLRGDVITKIPYRPGAHAGQIGDQEVASGALARTAAGTPYLPGSLRDLSISRTSFKWGIPVPGHEDHVIYVWLDALANYMTAIGYGSDAPEDIAKFERYWPADLHLVGKEIIRFHCVYWPAFLLALNPAYNTGQETEAANTNTESEATEPGAPPSRGISRKGGVSDEVRPPLDHMPELSSEQHSAWAEKMLPKAITAHGWLLFEDSKMSKSRGNIVRTETILDAFGEHVYKKQFPDSTKQEQDLFASDVLRYFLLREIPFGQDGSFSFDALITRYNADLANGYGNLVSRVLNLVEQNFPEGWVSPEPWFYPEQNYEHASDEEIQTSTFFIWDQALDCIEISDSQLWPENKFQSVLSEIMRRVGFVDAYLTFHKPWNLAKGNDARDRRRLVEVLHIASEAIRVLTAALYPILPNVTAKVWSQLGLGDIEAAAQKGELDFGADLRFYIDAAPKTSNWKPLTPGTKLGPLSPIFPRADKGLAQIMADLEKPAPSKLTNETTTTTPETPLDPTHPAAPPRSGSIAESNPITQVGGSASPTAELHKPPSHTEAYVSGPFASAQSSQPIAQSSSANQPSPAATPQITIDDFAKVELRVAKILVCERIPKADKLLRLEVDLGTEKRQILSGIAEWYAPEDLIGRKIVVITNLAPRKMRGLESHGMLLAASSGENGKPALATFADSDNIEVGARLK